MDSDEAMGRAIDLAREKMLAGEGRPFGCVILKDGEVVAIRDACKRLETLDLSGAELYTSCEPCPMCTSVIYLASISKLYYAASADDTELFGNDPRRMRREVGKPIGERQLANEQLMAIEGRALLLEWAESLNG